MGKKLFECIRFLYWATFLLMTIKVAAQPKALLSLQPERIETGDTASLLVFVTGVSAAPKDPDFSPWATLLPAKNIIARSEWRRSGAQWTRRFTLIAFDSAVLELPPLQIKPSIGQPMTTNALKLVVFPTKGGREISDMAGIREIIREPAHWTDYWPWAAGGLVLLFLVWWWWKNHPTRQVPLAAPAPIDAPPSISPMEKALQQLLLLEQKQYWKIDQIKVHYAELSLILREYIENTQHIAAMESTTAEIQRLLSKTSFPAENRVALIDLLHKADWVKYAQSQPPESEHQKVIETARLLIAPPVMIKSGHSPKTPTHPTPGAKKYEPL